MHGNKAMAAVAAALLGMGGAQAASTPLARCVLIDPATMRCRGLLGDGSDAVGAVMDVISADGRLLVAGKLDARSTLQFARPHERFHVLFDPGPGMQVTIEPEDIRAVPQRGAAAWMIAR